MQFQSIPRIASSKVFLCLKNDTIHLNASKVAILVSGFVRSHIDTSINPRDLAQAITPLVEVHDSFCYSFYSSTPHDKKKRNELGSHLRPNSIFFDINQQLLRLTNTSGNRSTGSTIRLRQQVLLSVILQSNNCRLRETVDEHDSNIGRYGYGFSVGIFAICKQSNDPPDNDSCNCNDTNFDKFLQFANSDKDSHTCEIILGLNNNNNICKLDDSISKLLGRFHEKNNIDCYSFGITVGHFSVHNFISGDIYRLSVQNVVGMRKNTKEKENEDEDENKNENKIDNESKDKNELKRSHRKVCVFGGRSKILQARKDNHNVVLLCHDDGDDKQEKKCDYIQLCFDIENNGIFFAKNGNLDKKMGIGDNDKESQQFNINANFEKGIHRIDCEKFSYLAFLGSHTCCCEYPNQDQAESKGYVFGFKL